MITLLIKRILAWLAGITAEQWLEAIRLVKDANRIGSWSGTKKREWVMELLKKTFPQISTAALNLLIETAVSYAKKGT